MATVISIDDSDDPRLADYVGLREATLRHLLETERGVFIAEGSKVIRRALEAGYAPRSFLLAERWLGELADLLDAAGRPGLPGQRGAGRAGHRLPRAPRGARVPAPRRRGTTVADVLAGRRVMVLQDLVDHTNVGAIIRNAAGLGWDGLLVSARCADPLYRRSIKVSMGTVFSLPWARLPDGRRHRRAAARRRLPGGRAGPERRTRSTLGEFAASLRADGPAGDAARHRGARAQPRTGWLPPTPWCRSRCRPGSTRSTWPRPARSPATRWR